MIADAFFDEMQKLAGVPKGLRALARTPNTRLHNEAHNYALNRTGAHFSGRTAARAKAVGLPLAAKKNQAYGKDARESSHYHADQAARRGNFFKG